MKWENKKKDAGNENELSKYSSHSDRAGEKEKI